MRRSSVEGMEKAHLPIAREIRHTGWRGWGCKCITHGVTDVRSVRSSRFQVIEHLLLRRHFIAIHLLFLVQAIESAKRPAIYTKHDGWWSRAWRSDVEVEGGGAAQGRKVMEMQC